jgi:hypothetical protein
MSADAAPVSTPFDQLESGWPALNDGPGDSAVTGAQRLAWVYELPLRRGPTALRGRRHECAVVDRLLGGVRGGRSGALVVRGEPGVGKTAMLEYATGSASDLRIE